jgi:FkbM family methyltransferase
MGLHFDRLVKPGMVCLDVGSHYGGFAMEFARSTGPTGKVYAVEPNPLLVSLTKESMEMNGLSWLEVDHLAITAQSGVVSFEETLWETIAARVVSESTESSITVQAVTLDEYMASKPSMKLDLLRIDNEGSECLAFFGGKETFRHNPDMIISFEWQDHLIKQLSTDDEMYECL